jgi:MFS family permease
MLDQNIKDNSSTNCTPQYRAYRFWPIYATAFTRTFSYSIYGLALPNYLVYFKHVSADLLGIILSVINFTFIFGPLIALQITKKLGLKNTVIISSIGSFILVALQIVFFDPVILIVLRGMDGIFTGFCWPNLQMEVSNWQRAGPPTSANKYFQNYGLSWNSGILLGDIVGFIIVYSGQGNEFLALIISVIFMALMIPCSLAMERPNSIHFSGTKGMVYLATENGHDSAGNLLREPDSVMAPSNEPPTENNRVASSFLLAFPALFYLVGTLVYSYVRSIYPLIVPLVYNTASVPSAMVYLFTFFYQAIMMVTIMTWSRLSARSGYYTWLLAMILNVSLLAWLWGFPDVISLTIAYVVTGACSGWLYNFTSKIMLEYGAAKNSLKYATAYEFFNGIGCTISPLLAGYIADVSISANYPVNLVIIIGLFVVLLILGKNARNLLANGKK